MADTMLEPSEAPRRVFERIVLRRGSLRGLGQRCGRSTMWIWRQLRQNKGVDLVKTGKVLDQLGVPIRFFYEEILDQTPEYDPAWLLEHYREGNGIPRDPFLAEVHDRLLNLVDRPSIPGGKNRRTEIDAIEEQRYFDRLEAKQGLEKLLRQLLSESEAASVLKRGQLTECANLLLIWGSIQRASGHRDDATDAYSLGYRLAVASRDLRVLGIFFYFSAHMLSAEMAKPAQALRFTEQATAIFQQLRDRDLLAQALVQTGVALFDLQKFDQARLKAIAALRLAPSHAWRTRAAAWGQLGNLALVRGQAQAALGKLSRAKRRVAGSSYVQAFVLWREATILSRLGRLTEAAQSFQAARELFEHFGQPLDVAYVALDLGEMLMRAGRWAETLLMAKAVTPTFESLRGNAQACALWLDLLALVIQGAREGSLAQVDLLRKALKMADPRIRLQQTT